MLCVSLVGAFFIVVCGAGEQIFVWPMDRNHEIGEILVW